MSGTRERLFGAARTAEKLEVGGVAVEMRSMSARDRATFVEQMDGHEKDAAHQLRVVMPAVVVLCAYDPDTGKRLFEEDDVVRLTEELDGTFLKQMFEAALRASGLDPEALKNAGNGSAPPPSEGSPTG